MRTTLNIILMAAMLLTNGCVLTLNSIFTDEDVAYDSSLEGTWQKDEATWTFQESDPKKGRYRLRTEMKDQPSARWLATLGTIGTSLFLELLPKRPPEIHGKTFHGGHFTEMYSFWKVELDNDTLILTSMSFKWLESKLKQNEIDIKYHSVDDQFRFLTASTPELQKFIEEFANDPSAFPSSGSEEGFVFTRKELEPDLNK